MADPVLGPVAVNDLFRVTFVQRIFLQRVINVLFYKVTDVPAVDPPDRWAYMGSVADYMTGAGKIQKLMIDAQSDELKHESIRVNRVGLSAGAVDPYFELATPDEGGIIETARTGNVAVSIEKRGTFPPGLPKQGIGRMQLCGIPQNGYSAGIITDDYLAIVQPLADEITESVLTAGVTAVPVLYGVDDELSGHVNPIFGTSVKRTIRIMRRRTVGVGE